MAQNPGNDPFDFELLTKARRSKVKPLQPSTIADHKESLRRTTGRSPEVMIKVSGGGKAVKQVLNHMTYIVRNGELEAVNENGEKLSSKEELKELLDDWDLESTRGFGRAKLTFNVVFSMPKGTEAQKVLEAAGDFARSQFWGKHQYLMVLHEDRDHPHVHLVVKAQGRDNTRLYIRKDTLETWRDQFAHKLRSRGVDANATPRDLRGVTQKSKSIGLLYAERQGRSRVLKSKLTEIADALSKGRAGEEPWRMAIQQRREKIVGMYHTAAEKIRETGDAVLAEQILQFAHTLPDIVTERDLYGKRLNEYVEQTKLGHTHTPEQAALAPSTPAAPKAGGRGRGDKEPDQER